MYWKMVQGCIGSIKKNSGTFNFDPNMRVVRMEKQPRALNHCVPTLFLYAFRCFRTYRGGRRLYGKLKLNSNYVP